MKNTIEQISWPIKEVKELLDTATWTIIHGTFSAVSKIMSFVPKWYFLDIVKNNVDKIDKILDEKDLPDVVKKTFNKVKDITDNKSEFWEYFDKLSEREKNIERFKLMLFSVLLLPWWTLIVAWILWNPAMMLYLNAAFLLPKENMPKPVWDLRDSIVNFSKDKYWKMKNLLWIN